MITTAGQLNNTLLSSPLDSYQLFFANANALIFQLMHTISALDCIHSLSSKFTLSAQFPLPVFQYRHLKVANRRI